MTISGSRYRVLTVQLPNHGAAQVALSMKSDDMLLATIDERLLLIAVAGTLLATSLAWFIARQTVRPIEQLTQATARVAQTQDLTHHIPVERGDEVGRLAESFNVMLAGLRTSRAQQKRLVADASHELRTPLTVVRTNVEVLARTPSMNDTDRAELLNETAVELKELSGLVAALVDLATDPRSEEPLQRV